MVVILSVGVCIVISGYDWKKQIQGDRPDPLINKVLLPIELKKKIVREIVSGNLTHEEAQKNYNIPRLETIKAWCFKYSYQIEEPKGSKMEKNKDKEESSEERSRIKELEKAVGRGQAEDIRSSDHD